MVWFIASPDILSGNHRIIYHQEERGRPFAVPCLLPLCHVNLFLLHAILAKGGPLQHALARSRSFTSGHRSSPGASAIPRVSYCPAGRDGERHAARKMCEFLSLSFNLGRRARGCSSSQKAVHERHHHLRSLAREVLRAHVRRVRS